MSITRFIKCGSLLAVLLAGCQGAARTRGPVPRDMTSTPLIPRSVLFSNPDKTGPQISPDGTRLAYLAEVDGVLNVWVAPMNNLTVAQPVTKDTKRGIRIFQWAFDNQHILYNQDQGGDENWHVYATNLRNMETRDLTPLPGVQARIEQASYKFPGEILVGINDRDKSLHDIYRVNIASGERTPVQQNSGYVGFLCDDDYKVRFASKMLPDGGMQIDQLAGSDWSLFTSVPAADALSTQPVGFDKSGQTLYMIDSRGRDTSALMAHDLRSSDQKLLAANPKCDVGSVMIHPTENTVQAVNFNYERDERQILDSSIKRDMSYLAGVCEGEIEVSSRSLDDKHWIVTYVVDDGPVRYYHYDRDARKASFMFSNRSKLENLPLAKMHPVKIKSRDNMELVSYLTLPVWTDRDNNARPDHPLPMVLFVHGGPWARDTWGLNGTHQWLSNRGYAVLSVNFRGSTGLGKNFTNSGNKEWAAKMHDDLIDAVDWAINQKIAEPDKVAIMGGSYGGYSTLVGLTFTPDKFACGVDIVGPSNLVTLLNSIPAYWKPQIDMFTTRVGDHRTEEGRKFLEERSPLTYVSKIKKPLLIGQGANDPRVKQAEADQIVAAMKQNNIPVTYVLYSDEGHGFARPENRTSFNAVTEAFLAQHLGGRFEPVGEDFKGSTIKIVEGGSQVPGLPQS
jgi:dipeptidyl aminopeptidase/acylaminoacyl peptidase